MLQRDDLLRLARIIDHKRYFTPSLRMLNDPLFEYEYVQAASHKKWEYPFNNSFGFNPKPTKGGWLDTYGYCIQWQMWKKARRHSAFDPCITETEMTRKIQNNEVRTKKEIKTSELRTMLETLPLQFTFENGIQGVKVVVLPKLTEGDPHKVYVRWSTDRDLYCQQYALDPRTDLFQKWFNSEKANSTIGQDWRYLLNLNDIEDATNELYKIFDGVYTGEIEFRLEKGTEIYSKEFFPDGPLSVDQSLEIFDKLMEKPATKLKEKRIRLQKNLRPKSKPRINYAEERQKMVCIKDPKNGNIIRVAKYYTGKFIKDGFTFVPKEEYKLQQKLKYEKRKDMAEGNREAQLLKYKGPKTPIKPKGIPGSSYTHFQVIEKETIDKKVELKIGKLSRTGKRIHNDTIISTITQETIQVKRLVPQYEYKPVVWEVWSYREEMKPNSKGVMKKHRWKDKLIETIPFLNEKGEPRKRKYFTGNKEVWVTVTRPTPIERKTIKVLCIHSKKMGELKSTMAEVKFPTKPEGATLILPTVRSPRTRYLLSEDKNGNRRLDKLYLAKEDVKRPEYTTYLVTKRDSFGKVVNIAKRKLVK